ncbi:hypothetical protein [Leifsonia sp. NPDC080035]|uniref:Glycosyltransferase RgtA/B/C/D-like domain-containing protein n=1 Tax=Leifsonia sp. NPDC080035 TaxID=3143936 RepID=A0AAU7GGC8_9MICO
MSGFGSVRRWFSTNGPEILTWTIVAVTWVLSYLSYFRRAGLFFYDSRYYMAYSFLFGGASQQEARDRTAEFAAQYHIPMPDAASTFGWGLVQPRVVLPTLSAPFVDLFGPFGLAVIPAVATIIFTIIVTRILMKRYGNLAAVATMVMANASVRIVVLMTGMLTESLSALWTLLALLLAWRYIRSPRWTLLLLMAVVTIVSAFTRQATLIMAGAFVGAWLLGMLTTLRWRSPWMWPAIVVGATAVIVQVVQTALFPFSQTDQFLRMTGTTSLGEALTRVPGLGFHLFVLDVNQFIREDQILLLMFFLSVGALFLFWKREEAHLLFGAMVAIGLYNITNGSATGFRYAIPGLVFFLLILAKLFQSTARTLPLRPRDGIPTDA